MVAAKFAIWNQVQITAIGSLLPSWAYRGRFAPKRVWGLGKRMAFPASLTQEKNRKAAEVRRALPIRMLPDSSDHPTDHAASQRGAVQRTRPPAFGTVTAKSGCQNAVIAALTFTGRILRRPAATPRMALRRRRPLRAVPQSDRRPRPLRAADEMGLVAVDVQRPRARHRPDNALRPALRRRRERGLSGMRHPCPLGSSCPPTTRASG